MDDGLNRGDLSGDASTNLRIAELIKYEIWERDSSKSGLPDTFDLTVTHLPTMSNRVLTIKVVRQLGTGNPSGYIIEKEGEWHAIPDEI